MPVPTHTIAADPGAVAITGTMLSAGVDEVVHSLRLEALLEGLDGPWTDLSEDLVGEVALAWGQKDTGALDRMAGSGSLTFALLNTAGNSGGQVGYYSPTNPRKRPGWKTGVPIRLTFMRGIVPYVKHVGWLDRIAAEPGESGAHPVECTSVDWLDQAARHHVRGIATMTDARADEVIAALVAGMPVQPSALDLDAGSETYAFALDTASGSYLTELSKVVLSEYGYGYLRADGTLRFEARTRRLNTATPSVLIAAMHELEVAESQDDAANVVRVSVVPREADDDPVVLASLRAPIEIGSDQTVTVDLKYVDPEQRAAHVGGVDMEPPEITTDYLLNTLASGLGTNISADLDVVAAFGGTGVTYQLTNNNAATAYVTRLQARGRGLYTYEPLEAEVRDQAAIDAGGERDLSLDMPYQSDVNVAFAVAENLLLAWAEPGQSVSVTFLAEHSAEHMACLYERDIGDAVAVVETVTGVNGTFWIQGIEITQIELGLTWVTWHLAKADTGAYWQLEIVGAGELGETTILGPL